jgi:Dolichyl-phosphate-mannose-protein mannosyltransferase
MKSRDSARAYLRRILETLQANALGMICFAVILSAAIFFRMVYINLVEFKADQALESFVAQQLVHYGAVPLVGPVLHTGGNSGPFYYYILALPYIFSSSPILASAFIVLLNLFGIIVTFKLVLKFFNLRAALITTALYALSPPAIELSRVIWNPDVVFPFVAICLYCLYSFAIDNRPVFLVPLFVIYAITLQIHPITLFIAPAIVLFLWKFRSQINWKYFRNGLAFGIATFLPFIYGEVTSGFSQTKSFVSLLPNFGNFNPEVLFQLSSLTSGSSAPQYQPLFPAYNNFFVVEDVCLFLGVAFVFFQAVSKRSTPLGRTKHLILFCWIALPLAILLFFNPTGGLLQFNTVGFLPANFLAIALFFDFVLTCGQKVHGRRHFAVQLLRIGAIAILILILASQSAYDIHYSSLLSSQGGTRQDGAGLQYELEASSYIANNSNHSTFTISNNMTPGEIPYEFCYLISSFGTNPTLLNFSELHYIIVDEFSNPSAISPNLSSYPKANFGPITVYRYTGLWTPTQALESPSGCLIF